MQRENYIYKRNQKNKDIHEIGYICYSTHNNAATPEKDAPSLDLLGFWRFSCTLPAGLDAKRIIQPDLHAGGLKPRPVERIALAGATCHPRPSI